MQIEISVKPETADALMVSEQKVREARALYDAVVSEQHAQMRVVMLEAGYPNARAVEIRTKESPALIVEVPDMEPDISPGRKRRKT